MAAERCTSDRVCGDRAEDDEPERLGLEVAQVSSNAKNTPAIGALNVAEMPPAAPHATSSRSSDSGTRMIWPASDPSAEPICTIGPSRPTEPPEPMQTAEASDLTIGTCGRIRPPSLLTASITSGTP